MKKKLVSFSLIILTILLISARIKCEVVDEGESNAANTETANKNTETGDKAQSQQENSKKQTDDTLNDSNSIMNDVQKKTETKPAEKKTETKPIEKKVSEKDVLESNYELIKKLEIPFHIIYCILGLPLLLFGYRQIRLVLIFMGLVCGNVTSQIIISVMYDWETKGVWVIFSVLLGSFMLGVFLALVLCFAPRVGYIVKGLVSGLVFGVQIYNLAVAVKGDHLKVSSQMTIIILWAQLGVCLGTVMKEKTFVITTAYLGSFFIFRGLGSMFGNYPSMFLRTISAPEQYYLYFGLTIGLAILGIIVQLVLKSYYPVSDKMYRNFGFKEKPKINIEIMGSRRNVGNNPDYASNLKDTEFRTPKDSNLFKKNVTPGLCEVNTEFKDEKDMYPAVSEESEYTN